jgi:putative sugar O-methyltransferase
METAVANINRLNSLLTRLHASLEHEQPNVFGSTSKLWDRFLAARQGVDQYNGFFGLLNDANTTTTGVAGKVVERRRKLFVEYYREFVDASLLDRLPLSIVGTPTIVDFEGRPASIAYLENLRLFAELERMLTAAGGRTKGLRVAEIGAGYGGLAAMLLQDGVAASYTSIDLPENLRLGAYYLTEQFRDRPARFLESDVLEAEVPPGLSFATPGNIAALDRCRFDLIINSDSLGEMPRATARAYVAWIADHLEDDGLFFSKNGHRRGPDSVSRPSEYGYERFRVRAVTGMTAAGRLFDDHSHYILLQSAGGAPQSHDWRAFDAISTLYALGLTGELQASADEFVAGDLRGERKAFLDAVPAFMAETATRGKLGAFADYSDTDLAASASYLRGLAALVGGKRHAAKSLLADYAQQARSNVSEAIALFGLSQVRGVAALEGPYRCGGRTKYLASEVAEYFDAAYPLRKAIFIARNDVLRKKITAPELYKPSFVHRMKNRVMNLKTGRGWSAER